MENLESVVATSYLAVITRTWNDLWSRRFHALSRPHFTFCLLNLPTDLLAHQTTVQTVQIGKLAETFLFFLSLVLNSCASITQMRNFIASSLITCLRWSRWVRETGTDYQIQNEDFFVIFCILSIHMRYWPSVGSRWLDIGQVIFCVFMDRDERKSRSIKTQNERGQYPAILTEQAWSIKDLLYGQKITPTEFRFCGTNAGNPERPSCPLG